MMLGAHMPAAGGIVKAVERGLAIGCDCIQLFIKSPTQWAMKAYSALDAIAFQDAVASLQGVVVHDTYLVNMAAPPGDTLEKSRRAFIQELEASETLGIPSVVTHMGAHLGQGEAVGLKTLSASLGHALEATRGAKVRILLETTAGQGTCLGARFEHIAEVLDRLHGDPRIQVCLDTCHVFAAGYDIRTAEGYDATWAAFDTVVGLDRLQAIHVNDAKKPLGSRVDRHEHLGKGHIGLEAFRLLVNDARLARVPMILETPDAQRMHAENLALLRGLIGTGS